MKEIEWVRKEGRKGKNERDKMSEEERKKREK